MTTRRDAIALLASTAAAPLLGCATPQQRNSGLAIVGQTWIEGAIRASPIAATQWGDHRFDGELDDIGPLGVARRAAHRASTLYDLAVIRDQAASPADQVDASLLRNEVMLGAWADEAAETYAWDPLIYTGQAGGSLYSLMARDFAPLPERLISATQRMQALPSYLAQARGNLDFARTPRVHAETAIRQNPGAISIIDDMILSQADALPAADRARLTAAAEAAKAALLQNQRWLEEALLPEAQGDFRLGAALYDEKLARALNTPLSREAIKADALAAMAETRAQMYEIAAHYWAGRTGGPPTPASPSPDQMQAAIDAALQVAYAARPARDTVVAEAMRTLEESTRFVRERDLITLPDAPVRIIEMPEFQQGVAVAYCDSPGPLDQGLETFYAVSPIPASWSDEQTASFLREYNSRSIHELTVHEAMPGHYVQIWHSNRYPSTLRALLGSGTFIEGWACYAQDMMGEEGYFGGDPLRALINKKWALRVIANAILDIGVHVEGMEREEAMRLMTVEAFQEEREAAGKWIRAQVSSAQLPTYFVGWREHFALQAEAKARWAGAFSLKRYHDTVLSFGSPPARHVRSLMFNEPVR
jgi:uncharacterized protein (DUF885 family)